MKQVFATALLAGSALAAQASVIDFEGLTDADIVGDSLTVMQDGVSVTFTGPGLFFRDFSFFGVGNALSTTFDAGPITITFGGLSSDYVAFSNPLNINGGEVDNPIGTTYDAADNVLDTFQSNLPVHYMAGPGIFKVVYTEGSFGEGFVMGDFQFGSVVPEPETYLMMALGLAALAIRRRRA